MKCYADDKRCYIHGYDPKKDDSYKVRCRHGSFYFGDYCPEFTLEREEKQ